MTFYSLFFCRLICIVFVEWMNVVWWPSSLNFFFFCVQNFYIIHFNSFIRFSFFFSGGRHTPYWTQKKTLNSVAQKLCSVNGKFFGFTLITLRKIANIWLDEWKIFSITEIFISRLVHGRMYECGKSCKGIKRIII